MGNWLYHALVGNDADPGLVAFCRAVVGAVLTGGIAFLATWQTTDEAKVLISAGVSPALAYLLLRGGLEGAVDITKSRRK